MWWPKLEMSDFLHLNSNLHWDVIQIVTWKSVEIYRLINSNRLEIQTNYSLMELIEIVEKNIFNKEEIPEGFPEILLEIWNKKIYFDSSSVGIITWNENKIDILEWFYKSLADKNNITIEEIKKIFIDWPNLGFDGKMWLEFLKS